MDEHVRNFFCEYEDGSTGGNFHKVIALHEAADLDWKSLTAQAPILPRGWFELCRLPTEDRIQFSLDYWLSKLPYHPHIDIALAAFFGVLDDVGVYVTQKKYDDLFDAQMVYSISENRGFYRGSVGASETEILNLQKLFPDYILPQDYLAFLQIHNGFCKSTDCTGITSTGNMQGSYEDFQQLLESQDQMIKTTNGKGLNPKGLIPFYESFGMPFFQCFWSEWHPEQEMGNVYYSSADNTISGPKTKKGGNPEQMAFASFTDWLLFYLEQIEP